MAAAGTAASGVMAATARVPVLGVPAKGGALNGIDALLATVQMPGGIPVATFAIGKAGATNAAIFACQMMAMTDDAMAQRLEDHRTAMADKVRAADAEVRG